MLIIFTKLSMLYAFGRPDHVSKTPLMESFNPLKRIYIEYSGDAYSFQCGAQLLIWGENMIALVVGWVGECCSEPS